MNVVHRQRHICPTAITQIAIEAIDELFRLNNLTLDLNVPLYVHFCDLNLSLQIGRSEFYVIYINCII